MTPRDTMPAAVFSPPPAAREARPRSPLDAGNGLLVLFGLLAIISCALEATSLVAQRQALVARSHLAAGNPQAALASAGTALGFNPYQPQAHYSQSVALKRLNLWAQLATTTDHALDWNPDATAGLWLAGDAYFRTGRPDEAAERLWAAFWRDPAPSESPLQLWRIALLTGREAWSHAAPENLAAAVRLAQLARRDLNRMEDSRQATNPREGDRSQVDRRAALSEAASALAAAAPVAAQASLSK